MRDDYNASVRWASAFCGRFCARQLEAERFGLKVWTQICGARCAAIGGLIVLACAAAVAGQTSTSDAPENKPAAHPAPAHPATTSKSAAATKSSSAKGTSKTHTAGTGKHSSRKKTARVRGQQKIDSERAQAIQEALIRAHYLSGEATGTWNEASEQAMRRYQADQGWQSKTVPDSRALIKLGLGPSKDHLLNPESAMTTVPDQPRAEPLPTTSHTTAPTADPAAAQPAPPANPNDASRPQ